MQQDTCVHVRAVHCIWSCCITGCITGCITTILTTILTILIIIIIIIITIIITIIGGVGGTSQSAPRRRKTRANGQHLGESPLLIMIILMDRS